MSYLSFIMHMRRYLDLTHCEFTILIYLADQVDYFECNNMQVSRRNFVDLTGFSPGAIAKGLRLLRDKNFIISKMQYDGETRGRDASVFSIRIDKMQEYIKNHHIEAWEKYIKEGSEG